MGFHQIRGRDREIAPTEDSHKEVAIGRSLYRGGVGFYQIRGRDREIAPTEEGLGIKKSRDREIAPTEDSHKEVAIGRSLLQKIESRNEPNISSRQHALLR